MGCWVCALLWVQGIGVWIPIFLAGIVRASCIAFLSVRLAASFEGGRGPQSKGTCGEGYRMGIEEIPSWILRGGWRDGISIPRVTLSECELGT